MEWSLGDLSLLALSHRHRDSEACQNARHSKEFDLNICALEQTFCFTGETEGDEPVLTHKHPKLTHSPSGASNALS